MKTRNLICACCGGNAPAYKQWFNQDTGYGVCARCFNEFIVPKEGPEEAIRCYGKPGIHHSLTKTVQIGELTEV